MTFLYSVPTIENEIFTPVFNILISFIFYVGVNPDNNIDINVIRQPFGQICQVY